MLLRVADLELHLFEVHLEVTEHFYGHLLPTSYSTYAIDVKNAIGTICGLPLYVDPFALHRRLQRSNCLSTAIPPLLFPAKGTTLYVLGTSTVLIGLGRSRLNIEAAPPTATTSSAAESAASPSAEPPIYAAPRRRHTRRHRRHVGRRVDAAVAAAPTTPFPRRKRRHALPTAHSTEYGTVRPADAAPRTERQRGHMRQTETVHVPASSQGKCAADRRSWCLRSTAAGDNPVGCTRTRRRQWGGPRRSSAAVAPRRVGTAPWGGGRLQRAVTGRQSVAHQQPQR